MKNKISMRAFGRMGRFGNQLFQYMFLKTYALKFDLDLQLPPWIGNSLFGVHDLPLEMPPLPVIRERDEIDSDRSVIPFTFPPFVNCDFKGWFQYRTAYYRPYESFIRTLFRPVSPVLLPLWSRYKELHKQRNWKTLIGIHIRRGDYGKRFFFLTPLDWFMKRLEYVWPQLADPVLYIATEDPSILSHFQKFNPLSDKDFAGCEMPHGANYYRDFWMLSKCQMVYSSNSTFSFAASMLNDAEIFAKIPFPRFWRPVLSLQDFVAYDPWDAKPLLQHETVEQFPHVYGVRVGE